MVLLKLAMSLEALLDIAVHASHAASRKPADG
jgi:hypothetical protein